MKNLPPEVNVIDEFLPRDAWGEILTWFYWRIGGTISSILFTLSQGIQIFRVHDVKEVKQGILVYKKLLNQWKKNILEQTVSVEL